MKKQIITSTIIIFTLGYIFHYIYDLSNQNFIVGIFAPTNESIFEHMKLLLYPSILWWIYFLFKNKNRNFLPVIISIILSISLTISLYYVLKCGFNIESSFINITNMFISILISQVISLNIYNKKIYLNNFFSLFLIIFTIIIFIYFTFNPPKLPFFQDPITKSYGINQTM